MVPQVNNSSYTMAIMQGYVHLRACNTIIQFFVILWRFLKSPRLRFQSSCEIQKTHDKIVDLVENHPLALKISQRRYRNLLQFMEESTFAFLYGDNTEYMQGCYTSES